MEMFEGWAPPGRVWGPWVEIGELFGTYTYKVDFKTISNAPSTFDAELLYWGAGRKISEIVSGPGTHNFTAGNCLCVQRIRFRSHTLGQIIKVTVD